MNGRRTGINARFNQFESVKGPAKTRFDICNNGSEPMNVVYVMKVLKLIGTKQCMHCGGRVGGDRFRPTLDLPPGSEDVLVEEEPARRSGLSPFTLVWVALLLAGYFYRACAS